MTKEEFIALWEGSTREEILNQFYYDYREMVYRGKSIKKLEEKNKKQSRKIDRAVKYIDKHTKPFFYVVSGLEPYISTREVVFGVVEPDKLKKILINKKSEKKGGKKK